MFLILGLVMLIFGEGWTVFGIPARPLGFAIVALGIVESYYWASRSRAQTRSHDLKYQAYLRGVRSKREEQEGREAQAAEARAAREADLVQRVALSPDGTGAVFYLTRAEDGSGRWNYYLDPEVGTPHAADNPGLIMRLDQAIYRMEQKLGLPEGPGATPPWATEEPREKLPGWPWEDVPNPPSLRRMR